MANIDIHDLECGDIVELRNGDTCVLVCSKILDHTGGIISSELSFVDVYSGEEYDINLFSEDLRNLEHSTLDIVKVCKNNIVTTVSEKDLNKAILKRQREKIYNFYGEKHQINKLLEEIKELAEAIESGNDENVLEEFCDVKLVMDQIYENSLAQNLYDNMYEYKIRRTLKRLGI